MIEFLLFFAIGFGILVFEAHRQFNHPAYSRDAGDESGLESNGDYIYSLSPSEIRSRSAFVSAELVYIALIVAMYLALVYVDAVNNVLQYIIGFQGANVPDPSGQAEGAATAATYSSGDPAIDRAAEPFVVSMMMVTALRFPLVRRLEVMLRGAAQGLFGIPRIPHRLRRNIEDTAIDLDELESDLGNSEAGRYYLDRIALYSERAGAAGMSPERTGDLAAALAKLAAYQLWVNVLKLWPSPEFRSDFRFFQHLNGPLPDQINELFKDCDLLASSGALPGDVADPAATDERRRMQQELWELKAKQIRKLARELAAMMALYDQNSKWPDPDKSGATSLRSFLEGVRSTDQARVFQINVAILLLIISAGVSFAAGFVQAGRLESIARSLGAFEAVGADDPQFDRFVTAWNFMLSSLIVYGLSMWAALDIRGRMLRNGRWVNAFGLGRRIPPMGQLALFFAVLGALVFAANLVFLLLNSQDWSPLAERDLKWWGNVRTQASLSLIFAVIGAFHGTAVALMMDLGARDEAGSAGKVGGRGWLMVAAVYISAMMLLGYGLGSFYSDVFGSGPEVRAMREMLYAIDLGLIALFTSIAMILFLRPDPNDAAARERAKAAKEKLA